MPLLPGPANIGKNIKELEANGTMPRSKKQILAIALSVARKPVPSYAPERDYAGLGKKAK